MVVPSNDTLGKVLDGDVHIDGEMLDKGKNNDEALGLERNVVVKTQSESTMDESTHSQSSKGQDIDATTERPSSARSTALEDQSPVEVSCSNSSLSTKERQARIDEVMQIPVKGSASSFRPRLVSGPPPDIRLLEYRLRKSEENRRRKYYNVPKRPARNFYNGPKIPARLSNLQRARKDCPSPLEKQQVKNEEEKEEEENCPPPSPSDTIPCKGSAPSCCAYCAAKLGSAPAFCPTRLEAMVRDKSMRIRKPTSTMTASASKYMHRGPFYSTAVYAYYSEFNVNSSNKAGKVELQKVEPRKPSPPEQGKAEVGSEKLSKRCQPTNEEASAELTEEEDIFTDMTDKVDIVLTKRKLIQDVSRDTSITPQERQTKMNAIMAGRVYLSKVNKSLSSPAAMDLRRIAVQAIMGSKRMSLQERDAKIQQLMGPDFGMDEDSESNSESKSESDSESESEDDSSIDADDDILLHQGISSKSESDSEDDSNIDADDDIQMHDCVVAVPVDNDSIAVVATPIKKRSSKIIGLKEVLLRLACPCCKMKCSQYYDNTFEMGENSESKSESEIKSESASEGENGGSIDADDDIQLHDGSVAVAVVHDSITVFATPVNVTKADNSMDAKPEAGKKRSSKVNGLMEILLRLACTCCKRKCSHDHDNNPSVNEKKVSGPPLLIQDHHNNWVLVENYEAIDAVEVAVAVAVICDDHIVSVSVANKAAPDTSKITASHVANEVYPSVDATAVSIKHPPNSAKVVASNAANELLNSVLSTIGVQVYKFLHPKELFQFSLTCQSVHKEVSKGLIQACLLQIPPNFGSEGRDHCITFNSTSSYRSKKELLEKLLEKIRIAKLRLLGTEDQSVEDALTQARRVLSQSAGAKFVSCNSELPEHLRMGYLNAGYNYEADNKELAVSRCNYILSRPYEELALSRSEYKAQNKDDRYYTEMIARQHKQLQHLPTVKTWMNYILSQGHVVTGTWFWSCRHRNLDFQGVEGKGIMVSSPHAEGEEMEMMWTRMNHSRV